MGGLSGYIISCSATASQISSLQRWTPFFTIETPQAVGLGPLEQPACRLGHALQPSGVDPKNLTKRANFNALLQMPRHHCKADDTHVEWVSCLGKSHVDAALGLSTLIASFMSCLSVHTRSFVSESDSAPRHRLRATWSRSVWVKMNWMTALDASDAEELSGSVTDPALLPPSASCNARIRVMTRAVNEGLNGLRLRSHLAAGWTSGFFRGAIRPSANARPLLPWSTRRAHEIVTRPLLVSHSSFCLSCSYIGWRRWRKGTQAPASSGWICGRTSLPAHSYRMEGEGEPSVKAVQSPIYTRWTYLLSGWTSGLCATLYGCAPGLPGQDARQWGSRSGYSLTQGPEERDRSGSTHHQCHRPGYRAYDVQPDSVTQRSGFVRQPVWTSCGGLCWMLHGGLEVVLGDATLPP